MPRIISYPVVFGLVIGCFFVLVQLPCEVFFAYSDADLSSFTHELLGWVQAMFGFGFTLGILVGLGAASEVSNHNALP
jgi:hypothetical protein